MQGPVFGMLTYRTDAEIIDARLGLFYGISERGTLNFDYRFIQARTDMPLTYSFSKYDSRFVSLGLHTAF